MKALVFDLDETLLNSNKEIGRQSYSALCRWLKKGKQIILATSRPIRSVRKFIPPAFLEQVTTITLNGCIVHEPDGSFAKTANLGEIASGVVETLLTDKSFQPVYFSLEFHGEGFASNGRLTKQQLWDYHAATPDMVINLDKVNYHEVTKIAIDGIGNDLSAELAWLNSNNQLNAIAAINNTFINVVPKSVDKSHTLTTIIKERDIKPEEIAVFGDDIPDLGMMQIAGMSIAMANSHQLIKDIADITIGHHNDDIIGAFIDEMLL
jgi:Cof subfamily protein (haloacid dehalogenase superfamily)